jgi:hypothetical protein
LENEPGVGRVLSVRELEALYFKITETTVLSEAKLDHFVAATEAIPEKRPRGFKIFTCSADGGVVNFVALCTFQFPSFFHLAIE